MMRIALIILIIAVFYIIGHLYVKEGIGNNNLNNNSEEQEYVKRNRQLYGVSNRGTSLNNKKIFKIDVTKIGM